MDETELQESERKVQSKIALFTCGFLFLACLVSAVLIVIFTPGG